MGPNISNTFNAKTSHRIARNYFDFICIIGRGGFGKVWKVKMKQTKDYYALKEMSKVKVIDRKSEKSIKSERDLLSILNHPLIVNMHYAFQDYDNLYLVMDFLTGGDLRYQLFHHRKFSHEQTRFFIACLISGLEYIHSNRILHRDIKPENLVCDRDGYLRITDFGVAKRVQKDNSMETSGTPGYMAPEVLFSQNHSFPSDYFAVGVIGYEFMFGVRPYVGKNRKEIKDSVFNKQVYIKRDEKPSTWSLESVDFINRLLQRKPHNRLGNNGIEELKNHPWMKPINWESLVQHRLLSPFIPSDGDNFDKRYCEANDNIGEATFERYQIYVQDSQYTDLFDDYNFLPQIMAVRDDHRNNSKKEHDHHYHHHLNQNSNNQYLSNSTTRIVLSKQIISTSPNQKQPQPVTLFPTNTSRITNQLTRNKGSDDLFLGKSISMKMMEKTHSNLRETSQTNSHHDLQIPYTIKKQHQKNWPQMLTSGSSSPKNSHMKKKLTLLSGTIRPISPHCETDNPTKNESRNLNTIQNDQNLPMLSSLNSIINRNSIVLWNSQQKSHKKSSSIHNQNSIQNKFRIANNPFKEKKKQQQQLQQQSKHRLFSKQKYDTIKMPLDSLGNNIGNSNNNGTIMLNGPGKVKGHAKHLSLVLGRGGM